MHGFQPNDVYLLLQASDPRVSPDGRRIAFVLSQPDKEKNEYASRIWMATISDGGDGDIEDVRPLTVGDHRESRPRWSPDGRHLAYVSHRQEKGSELMLMPTSGGEPRTLAELPEEIESPEWSPDSSRIAFLAREPHPRYESEKPKDQSARRIDKLVYRLDSVGWIVDRKRRLFVIEVEGGEPRRLTDGDFEEEGGPSWSPDSTRIAFVSARHDTWDLDGRSDLFVVQADGGEPDRITSTDSSYARPAWSPQGDLIAFQWTPEPNEGPWHNRIGVIDLADREPRILTSNLDRNAAPYFADRGPIWVDGWIHFFAEEFGDNHLFRVSPDGGDPEKLIAEPSSQITGYDHVAGTSALVVTTPTRLPHLRVLTAEKYDAGDRHGRPVAHPEPSELYERDLPEPERFTAISADGTEVEAWVMRPAGFDASQQYPMVLNIHGGPFTQYGNKFFDEFQCYCGAGYVVVYSNPRGSAGYSESWGRAIRGPKTKDPGSGWGALDYQDLMAVTDTALERFDFIDASRVGVMGGSYGGYMTTWIIGHTDRFKAAISERAVNSMLSMAWTSDIGTYFSSELGPSYLEDSEEYLKHSPIHYVENIRTPVLILHSEGDLRCPIEQAEQLFTALKLLGREVEFVRFPGESHELTRSGAPAHRAERFEIVLDWLERKLR